MSTICLNPSILEKCKFNKSETLVLNYLIRQPLIEIANPPVLIVLQEGNNKKELYAYADKIPKNYLVVLAQAPYKYKDRYNWFDIHFVNNKITINNEQAEKSRIILLQFINQIVEKYNANQNKVYLLGLHQGTIIALSVALTRPDKVKGIARFRGQKLEISRHEIRKIPDLQKIITYHKNVPVLNFQQAIQTTKNLKFLNEYFL